MLHSFLGTSKTADTLSKPYPFYGVRNIRVFFKVAESADF